MEDFSFLDLVVFVLFLISISDGVCPGDLLIIIDNSGSVQDVFEQQKQTAKAVIDQLDVGTIRVALISYNQRAKVVLDFDQSQSKSEISGILANLSQEGGTTNTAESLQVARGDFSRKSRSEVTLLVLLITDGHSQNSLEDLRTNMAEFNKSGIVTLAASVSPNPDVFELSIYANGRADRTFLRNNLTQLPESIVKILGTSCNRQDIKEIAVFKPMPQISGSGKLVATANHSNTLISNGF